MKILHTGFTRIHVNGGKNLYKYRTHDRTNEFSLMVSEYISYDSMENLINDILRPLLINLFVVWLYIFIRFLSVSVKAQKIEST